MKKHFFLKSFALIAMLFSAMTLSAQSGVDWETIDWIGSTDANYTNKFKCSTTEGLVNIQHPGFASEIGIYMTFTAAGIECNLTSYDVQGAGMIMHLSAFTAKETEVVVNYAGGSRTFWVYYADGTEGGGDEGGEEPDQTPDPEVTDKWASLNWLGNGSGLPENTDKYKISQNCLQEVVNIQKPGWADEPGIYVVAPGAIESCSVNGAIQGGGMVLYLSSFTAKETEVTINYAGGSCTFWVYYADGTEGGEGGEEPDPTPEPDPEETIIAETYFAPGWVVDPTSSAIYDPNTGTITVDIKNALSSQWQGQVKVKHDVAFSADKQYTLSCKFHATAAVNGVTIKMDDNQDDAVVFENATVNLQANQDYDYTSAPSNGIAGNNQILVFDFGWAPACQITISDIVIQEVEPAPEEPGDTDKWAGVDWVAASDNKYKVSHECLSSVVNVQQPPWAAEKGIYVTAPAGIISCTVDGAIDGAGMILYLSSFTAKETEVTITHGAGTCTFWVYYADGTEGGAEGGTPTEIYDTNFALTANGATAEATSGDPALALDNNTGSRWESEAADPQTFIIDLGQERIFNTLEIVWEGAYAKTFTVSTSSDKAVWTPVWTEEGQALADFPYTQTKLIDKTTAQYIKFEGTERGTPYGYSFWEFRVYLAGVSTLTTLEAKAESAITKVGATNAITITPKDQNGQAMANAGEVTYTITPADAGTITGNVYTPAKIGAASIVASIGEVAADAFEVVAYDGENVAFSADRINANKVIAQSGLTDGSSFDAWYAVDGNDGSVWQGSLTNGTAGDEAARTFDSWFVVDFGAYYDINLVSIKFEGACSQDYHIDFSADNATWNVAYNHVGNAGVNAHTKYIYGGDLQNTTKVRYARFYSTKAATEWGVKLFEFQVYGLPFVASGDTEKPVMGTATLDSNNHNTAIITVTATDNDEVAAYHIVDNTNSYDQTLAPTDGKITLVGLNPETAYALTITALDLAGNESENAATVSFTTNVYNLKPTAAPAAPTHEANKVQSVFCDVYGGTFSAMEGWGQTTQFEELNFDGNHVRYYTDFNYLGWAAATPINASAMEKLHLDIWAPDNATLDIVPIYGGDGLKTDDAQRKKVTLVGQQWNSIYIDLATDFPNLNLNSIFQFKFDTPNGTSIFAFDNVYFYRVSEVGDVTPPTNLTATAVPAFETAVINCSATDESGSVKFKVMLGDELKGTGSANSGETAAITVTNLQAGREFTLTVIATDVYGNESAETVDVTFTTLAYPAPAPTPTWDVAKVKSIYSESYTPAWTSLNSYNEWWWNAPQMLDAAITNENHALYYYGFIDGMIGWQFNAFDATGCTTFTMDIYPMNDGTIDFGPLGEGNNDYAIANVPVKGGQWNTIRIDLTGKDLTEIFQVKMINYYSLGAFFIDNVYLVDALVEGIVINDDTDLTQLQNALPHNLKLQRNLVMDGDWNTICLPFALTEEQVVDVFGEGTTLVELKRSELISNTEINLVFEDVTSMKASTPYLIIPTKEDVLTGVELEGVVINLTPNVIVTEDANMIPVLKPQSFTGADNTFYLGANENLYPRPSSGQIKSMRAYFQFPNLTAEQARNMRARVVFEENEETALDNLSTPQQKAVKVIYNGQLIIIRNGEMYNAQGIKL